MANPIRQLEQAVFDRIKKHGFKYWRGEGYQRPFEGGWVMVELAPIRHGRGHFDVVVQLGIRHHAVQESISFPDPLLKPADAARAVTLSVELGNLTIGHQRRWSFGSEEDIEPVANSIASAIEEQALPFLERFSSLPEVLSTLQLEGSEGRAYCPFESSRWSAAVAVAVELGRRDLAKELLARGRERIREVDPGNLVFFEKAITALQERRGPIE